VTRRNDDVKQVGGSYRPYLLMRAPICAVASASVLIANQKAYAWITPAIHQATSVASARTLYAARLTPHRQRVRAYSSSSRSVTAAAATAMNADPQPGQALHTVVLVRHGLSTFNKVCKAPVQSHESIAMSCLMPHPLPAAIRVSFRFYGSVQLLHSFPRICCALRCSVALCN
jgi:hypothetical protein